MKRRDSNCVSEVDANTGVVEKHLKEAFVASSSDNLEWGVVFFVRIKETVSLFTSTSSRLSSMDPISMLPDSAARWSGVAFSVSLQFASTSSFARRTLVMSTFWSRTAI